MVKARSTDLIFTADYSELQSYYGDVADSALIERMQKCHTKMQNCKSVLHVTTNLAAIADSKTLLMSAGGLGGCVYGVPVDESGVIHNLGGYIINDELPMFLKNQSRIAEIECIEIIPNSSQFGCVDYLDFGSAYYDCYTSSEYLRSRIDMDKLLQTYEQQSKIVGELHARLSSSANTDNTMAAIVNSSASSYIVRMLYFEVVIEYLFLHQDNQSAREWAKRAELYNKAAKDLVFELNPELATKFSLKNFHSSPSSVDEYLQSCSVIVDYRPGQFYEYLSKRLTYYIDRYLLKTTNNFKGHLLFRHFDERELFEADLAQRLWNEAKQKEVGIVTYRLPKGEVGVLPIPAKANKALISNGTCVSGESLDIALSDQLATAHTAMRDPYTNKERSVQ